MAYYFTQLRFGLAGEVPMADQTLLLAGKAPAIFQYRALIPWVVNMLLKGASILYPQNSLSSSLVFQTVELLSAFILFVAFRHYISLVIGDADLSLVLSIMMFSSMLFNYVLPRSSPLAYVFLYPWDIPSVMFFTLGLVLLYRRHWGWYYVLFPLATINRETTLFLTVVYLITALGRTNIRTIGVHVITQAAIWVGIKHWLYLLYGANPMIERQRSVLWTGFIDYQHWLLTNVASLFVPETFTFLLSVAGFTMIPVLLFWRMIGDTFSRRSLLLIVPWTLVCLLVGVIYELRIYGELIPVILMSFLYIVREALRRETVA